jgi:uncharacterized protein YPO0396
VNINPNFRIYVKSKEIVIDNKVVDLGKDFDMFFYFLKHGNDKRLYAKDFRDAGFIFSEKRMMDIMNALGRYSSFISRAKDGGYKFFSHGSSYKQFLKEQERERK